MSLIIVFIPELIIYGHQTAKANDLVEQTTKHAEMVGGVTPEVENRFKESLVEYGLDPKVFSVSYSSKGMIGHRAKFTVKVEGSYKFRTFNILGTGIGNFTLGIFATDSGVSEVWVR